MAAGRSAVIPAMISSKRMRSMPWGLSLVLSRNGRTGAIIAAQLTRREP